MAVTQINGWPTPDDSDNVADGAAAMRSLGAAIDAHVPRLLLPPTAFSVNESLTANTFAVIGSWTFGIAPTDGVLVFAFAGGTGFGSAARNYGLAVTPPGGSAAGVVSSTGKADSGAWDGAAAGGPNGYTFLAGATVGADLHAQTVEGGTLYVRGTISAMWYPTAASGNFS